MYILFSMLILNGIGRLRRRGPLKVHFEVTNRCNFHCDFCPAQVSTRAQQDMDYDLLQKGIEEVARDRIAPAVGFHVLGEPLLYSKLCDAIAYAKQRSLRTELTTNGSLLTADRVRALSEAGLDSLTISLQTDESEHACRGAGIPFDRYYRGVLDAVRLASELGRMEVVLCAMDTSTRWLFDVDTAMRLVQGRAGYREKLRRFVRDTCRAIGVPPAVLGVLPLSRPALLQLSDRVSIYAQPFADWGNAFTRRAVRPARFGACGYALANIGVLSNGDVTICCADYDGSTTLGNLRDASLAGLLASDAAQAIQRGFHWWRPVHPHCRRCLGSPGRIRGVVKGLVSIYLFGFRGFEPARVRQVRLSAASDAMAAR